jgi:hypothetical protein
MVFEYHTVLWWGHLGAFNAGLSSSFAIPPCLDDTDLPEGDMDIRGADTQKHFNADFMLPGDCDHCPPSGRGYGYSGRTVRHRLHPSRVLRRCDARCGVVLYNM